jgi:hypothetical protein
MPGPRSKRKRPSNDDPPSSGTGTARRRQREEVTGAEPATSEKNEKNEESKSNITDNSKSDVAADQGTNSTENNNSDAEKVVENPDEKEELQGGNDQEQSSSQQVDSQTVLRESLDSKSQGQNGMPQVPKSSPTDTEESATAANPSISGESRESRIRGLLTHRKLLLKRVRQSRKAARGEHGAVPGSKPSATAETEMTDEQEIASFSGMTREVVSLARKQARLDTEVPGAAKRTSVSLRRGSGVGKRMNAALSSLVPGREGGVASSSVDEVPSQSLQSVTKAPVAPRALAPPIGSIPPPPVVSRMTGTTLPGLQHSALKAPPSTAAGRPFSQKTSTGPRGMSSSAASALSSKPPLHTGLGASGLPPNRLAQPSVVCPEAATLRERRQHIRSKLLSIMNERQNQTQKTSRRDSSGTSGDNDALSSPISSSSTSKPSERTAMIRGCGRPPHLPGRRKTHWDYLLEEMRWTATDFIEERKWKASTARTIGKAILSPKETLVLQQTRASDVLRTDLAHAPKSNGSSDEEMDDTSASETKTGKATEGNQIECRPYVDVSSEHDESTRKAARIISNMISELSASIIDAGAFAQSDDGYRKALERHRQVRKQLEGDGATSNAMETVSTKTEPIGDDPVSKKIAFEKHQAELSLDKEGDSSEREKLFQGISDHVENLIDKIKKNGAKPKNQATSAKMPGLQVSLSTAQAKTMDSIEDYWTRLEAGAVLSGPFAGGKTIVACTILWKHRSRGPQLLVCSPASMVSASSVGLIPLICFFSDNFASLCKQIRWAHELGRFDGLHCRSIGLTGGISNPSLETNSEQTFNAGDIILCEYASATILPKRDLARFHSIVIDCRYPNGYLGSRSPTCAEEAESSKDNLTYSVAPSELASSSWWEVFGSSFLSPKGNRLLIDDLDLSEYVRTLDTIPDRQLLEVVALRAAFVIRLAVDQSRHTAQKTMLAWARKRIKDSNETGSKFERVKKVFVSLMEPVYCRIEGSTLLEEVKPSKPNTSFWEFRKCEVPARQRLAYERACVELRRPLSLCLNLTDDDLLSHDNRFSAVSDALLRLRRQCIHFDIESCLSSARVRTRLGWFPAEGTRSLLDVNAAAFPLKPLDSPSQPDLDLACRILEGSSKMLELVSILTHECQCSVLEEEIMKDLLQRENKKDPPKGKNKRSAERIVILAALPEVQVLASVLLNSIGIDHELLLRPTSSSVDADASTRDAELGSLAWADCQLTLSKFNTEALTGSEGATQVIIASPETAAGDHGGLGIELADIIVCLDEDWSGRGELLMKAIIARCLSRRASPKENGFRLIKLLAADTCEETFLSPDRKSDARRRSNQRKLSSSWPWPLNPFGSFTSPKASDFNENATVRDCWQSRQTSQETFTFTGRNIFECRDRDLAEVLSTKETLPPLLNTASDLIFMPSPDEDASVEGEMNIMRYLLQKEEGANPFVSGAVVVSLATPRLISVLPPLPIDFPKGLISRQDLSFLSTRVHLHRFGKTFDLQGTSAAIPPELRSSGAVAESGSADLAEPWRIASLAGKPTEVASSLLFYGASRTSVSFTVTEDTSPSQVSTSSSEAPTQRLNSYSSSFSCTRGESATNDGNQGSEALVYFPPLFPRMLESSVFARNAVASLQARQVASRQAAVQGESLKRTADLASAPDSKRPRLEQAENPNGSSAGVPEVVPAAQPLSQDRPLLGSRVITEDEASLSDPASVLLHLSDDYGLAGIGAVPFSRDSALAAAQFCVEASNAGTSKGLENEWFSLLGPSDAEEGESDDLIGVAGADSASMILFVSKKRARAGLPLASSLANRPQQSARPWPAMQATSSAVALPGSGNGVFHDINGAASGKKMKKKGHGQKDAAGGTSAFSRPPVSDQLPSARPAGQAYAALPFPKTKESYRHRLLSSSRQTGLGNTLFEAPAFRYAVVRMRKRVGDRLARHCWTSATAFEVGPGLPLIVSKQPTSLSGHRELFDADPRLWTSIVKRLKNKDSFTGEEAAQLAMAQRTALHRSLVAPSRVDFGPFQSGFLASPSGMTALSPPRARIGVTLPMGVKVPQSLKDMHQVSWSQSDDDKLQRCAVRFGLNWILASRVLSGFQDIVIFSQRDQARPPFPRAARSCRDRWQTLARRQPSLAIEVRQSERAHLDSSALTTSQILQWNNEARDAALQDPDRDRDGEGLAATNDSKLYAPNISIAFLLPSPSVKTPTEKPKEESDKDEKDSNILKPVTLPETKPKRTFTAFMMAKAKQQVIPMNIPGVVSGSPPTVVPSHPSHMQSVQSSAAASWSSGRTEMWPLQLLDAADKQRATAAAAAAAAAAAESSQARPSSSASRPHGNASSSSSAAGNNSTLPSNRPATSSAPIQRPPSGVQFPMVPPPTSASATSHSRASSSSRGSNTQNRSTSSQLQNFAPPPRTVAQPPPTKPPDGSSPSKNDKGPSGQPPA